MELYNRKPDTQTDDKGHEETTCRSYVSWWCGSPRLAVTIDSSGLKDVHEEAPVAPLYTVGDGSPRLPVTVDCMEDVPKACGQVCVGSWATLQSISSPTLITPDAAFSVTYTSAKSHTTPLQPKKR